MLQQCNFASRGEEWLRSDCSWWAAVSWLQLLPPKDQRSETAHPSPLTPPVPYRPYNILILNSTSSNPCSARMLVKSRNSQQIAWTHPQLRTEYKLDLHLNLEFILTPPPNKHTKHLLGECVQRFCRLCKLLDVCRGFPTDSSVQVYSMHCITHACCSLYCSTQHCGVDRHFGGA